MLENSTNSILICPFISILLSETYVHSSCHAKFIRSWITVVKGLKLAILPKTVIK